jgi:broad specificity phosphatase PhoE
MLTLFLIRHGETSWNADGRFQGHRNTPLSEHGLAQAHQLAQALAPVRFDALYTSDLARAALTADAIATIQGLTPVHDLRLREAFFGEWEGLTLPEVTERWPEVIAAWREDSLRTRPPGGETLEQVQQRVAALVDEVIAQYTAGTVAMVGHGGSVRAVIATALGADLSIFRRLRLDNCSISLVTVRDGHMALTRMNDICHLNQETPRATWDEAGDQWRAATATGRP